MSLREHGAGDIQDSRLLYYLIREIKTWLNINHITTHIVYFKTQRTVIENTKFI